MFGFGLQTSELWVTMAVLVLSFSICAHSSFLHDEEDEDQMAEEESQADGKDLEAVDDKDDNLEEGNVMEDTADFDNTRPGNCIHYKQDCIPKKSATLCCGFMTCLSKGFFSSTVCQYKDS